MSFAGYRNLSVKRKLQLIVMFTVGAALTLACAAILAYDQVEYRQEMRNDLAIQSRNLRGHQHRRGKLRRSKIGPGDSLRPPGQA